MSDIAQDWCRRQTDLTDGEFRVLHHLANYHSKEKGMAWPKAATLAKDTGKALYTVRNILRSLEAKGHIVRHRNHDNAGRQMHNYYTLNITEAGQVGDIAQAGAQNCPGGQDSPGGVGGIAQGGWAESPRGGGQQSPPLEEPVVEPTVEPTVEKPKRAREALDLLPGFDEFWALYGKRTAKVEAKKAWGRRVLTPELRETIMAALTQQTEWRAKAKECGVWFSDWPNGATWINGERWADEKPPELDQALSKLHQLSPELEAAVNTHEDWRDPLDTGGVFDHDDVPF